jgi:UDP-glucose 4-epimerase
MKILITGGAGYIGSIVAELALAQGHRPTVIDSLQEGHREAVPADVELIEGDFSERGVLDRTLGSGDYDAVLHLAAETTVAWSMTDPARYFENNLVKGLVLLDAMRRHRVPRIIFSSTAATYGDAHQVPMSEDHPQRPVNAYGESKLMFEQCLRRYHAAYGIRSVSFRYFNAAGATLLHGEDHRHESHLIPRVLEAALCPGNTVEICGGDYDTSDGTCVRDYVHVIDIARAHFLALDRIDDLHLEFFNIGVGCGSTVLQVIEAARRVTGRSIPSRVGPRRPGDPPALVASADKIASVMGWKPLYPDLESMISSAWAWRRRFPAGYDAALAIEDSATA